MSHPQTPRTSRDAYWRIDGAAGDLPLDHLPATTRACMPGDSMDIDVIVSGYSDPPDGSEEWPGWKERYYALLDTYAPTAGHYTVHELMGGGVGYTETHDLESGESVLVALRPPGDIREREGAWALIESIENETLLRGRAVLAFSLTYLADLATFADHAAVRDALESGGILTNI